MRMQSFGDWLIREVAASRMALISAYEKRDHLLYVEAPPLRKRYMDAIGTVEEGVLQAELEVALLRRKAELIQIALNRREPVDLAAIAAQLETEKDEKIASMEQADLTLNELPQLAEEQAETLQSQYREIIRNFQPAMNPDISDVQRELYQKALEAYKMQDAAAMQLIYDMLLAPLNMDGVFLPSSVQQNDAAEKQRELFRSVGRYKEVPLHSKIGMLRSIPRGKSDSELNVRLEEEQQNYEKAKTEYDELQQNLPELRNRLNSIDEWLASHGGEQWTRLEELLAQYVAVQKTIDDIERDFQQRRKAVQRELDALEEYNRTAQYKISTDHFKDQLKAYSPCGTIYDEYIDRVEYNELTLGVIKAEFQQIADRPDTDPVTFMEHIKEMSKILLEQRKNLAREIQRAESYHGRLTAFEKEIERLQIAVRKAEGSEMVKTFQENLNDYVTKLYREIVGPRIEELQKKYHVTNRTSTMRIAYRRDFYFMLYIFLLVFGAVERKSDRLFFLDEGQNISRGDYNLLFMLYPNAKWNIFGDLNQNLVSAAGVREWEFLPSDIKQFSMDENYRNPIQVTKMVNEAVGISMSPLGLPDGSVRTATVPMLTGIIQRTVGQGKSLAMIVASEGALRLMEAENPELRDKCKMVSDESPLCPKNCVPVYTVKSAHGMEFRNVIAFTRGMDRNMEYVAFTRTLQNLYIVR